VTFKETNEGNSQAIPSEDLETTRNTKQRLQQENFCHNKLNTEGWDAQEQRGHMKP